MELVLEKFSKRIRQLRKHKNVKQEDVAAYLNCSVRQYQRLEYGEVNVPATTLNALADYFGVTTDDLLGRAEKPSHGQEEE